MASQGIIYQLSGPFTAELLVVSLASLRSSYDGPVTVFCTQDVQQIAEQIGADARLNVQLAPTILPRGGYQCFDCEELAVCPKCQQTIEMRRPHWICKCFNYLLSPYDQTIYLDSDTVVLDDPSPLFTDGFTVARCADLRIVDEHQYPRSVRRQFRKFRQFSPILERMIDRCYQTNNYIINNGMLAFGRNHPMLREIHHLCVGLGSQKMHDEIAIQLIAPDYELNWVDGRWNALVAYETLWEERKIAHYHHKYYAQMERGSSSWLPYLEYAVQQDFAGISKWRGRYNHYIAALLRKVGVR